MKCSAEGCERESFCRGLCTMHYQRMNVYGRLHRVTNKVRQPCSIEGCNNKSFSRGWCGKHYQRWSRFGDPLKLSPPRPTPIERILPKLKRNRKTGCLIWTGRLNNHGYGVIKVKTSTRLVHRLMYEYEVGPIPEGLELDHLCRVPACAEFTHLEPVTHQENCRRGKRGVLRGKT
jgi:hypothetical protein